MSAPLPEMPCNELVEAITDYLEGTLPPDDRRRFEEHLAICEGCTTYLAQMRATIAAAGRIRAESLSQATRDGLLQAFKDWRRRR